MLFFKYNRFLTNFDLINKFSYSSSINIPFMERIVIVINISVLEGEMSFDFSRSLLLLEFISGQKSKVSKFLVSSHGRGQKKAIFSSLVVLRRNFLFNFLYFLHHFVILRLSQKFLVVNKKLSVTNYSFVVRDVSIFPGLGEFFLKWPYSLRVSLLPCDSRVCLEEFELILRNSAFFVFLDKC